jgi:beta-glucosidase
MKSKVFLVALSFVLIAQGCLSPVKTKKKDKIQIIEMKVDSLLSLMTLDEKIGQMVLYTSNWEKTGPVMPSNYMEDIKSGRCGNIFNAYTVAYTHKLQESAVKRSRLGIPLLFGYDIIHGFKTIFPIPLGEASSWDMDAIRNSARVAAVEGSASGVNWTFAPMVDIARDPRWGRISEGAGEDPYLGSRIAAARVSGFQGEDIGLPNSLLACAKHFAAYGAPLAGRDYNSVDMSERMLREVYLPPYKAAIDAGAMSVMSAFNELNGIPATGNHFLLTDILRNEWKFKGLVVTDYTSINEMVQHGIVANDQEAAELALNAGVDMDMQGSEYYNFLKKLVENGKISESQINESVRRILKVKFLLGLFNDPYRYCNEKREKELVYSKVYWDMACDVAGKSMVLLKNEGSLLPLKKGQNLAIIGPLADAKRDLLGSWIAAGEWDSITTVVNAFRDKQGEKNVLYAKGCDFTGTDRSDFPAAIRIARSSDVVVMVMGESWSWCGEAASRTSISIPDIQKELIREIARLKKPLVLVLLNGRPLALEEESSLAGAILEAWYPGTMGAKAIADILRGDVNPSGKLPVTFPRNIGQVPIYYSEKNTGRPYDPAGAEQKYRSRYIDCPNDPLYPFGFGLSYTKFIYSDLITDKTELRHGEKLKVSVKVNNSGNYDGQEVVQLYIRDMVGSVTRPLKELKGFNKILLKKGETKTVTFEIEESYLSFYRRDMTFGTEPGDFKVYVGGNSRDLLETSFKLVD